MLKKAMISLIGCSLVLLGVVLFIQIDNSNNHVALNKNEHSTGIKNALENGKGNKYGIHKNNSGESNPDLPNEDFVNQKPVAVIDILPSSTVNTTTNVVFNHSNSYDQDGDKLVNVEWIGVQDTYPLEGDYEIYLRVQDEHGEWSDWSMTVLTVIK